MSLMIDMSWVLQLILVSIRVAPIVYGTPFDAFGRVPGHVKLYLHIAISLVVSISLPALVLGSNFDALNLLLMAVRELIIGLALAFGIYCAFQTFNLAGRVLDFQIGFGAASLFNPTTSEQNPLIGTLLILLGGVVFFMLDGHYLVLEGVRHSLRILPPGNALPVIPASAVISNFGLMYIVATSMIAPIVAMLFMLDCGVAIVAKTMPQMNVYFLFLPLKILVGLIALLLTLQYYRPLMEAIQRNLFNYWSSLMA